jgi:predicted DNA-binding transcriptional regulator AlpA
MPVIAPPKQTLIDSASPAEVKRAAAPSTDHRPARLLARCEAAAYVGLSPTAFDAEVNAGTFPAPFPLKQTRRNLWDVKALDATLDRAAGLQGANDDREARKRAWETRRQNRAQGAG